MLTTTLRSVTTHLRGLRGFDESVNPVGIGKVRTEGKGVQKIKKKADVAFRQSLVGLKMLIIFFIVFNFRGTIPLLVRTRITCICFYSKIDTFHFIKDMRHAPPYV